MTPAKSSQLWELGNDVDREHKASYDRYWKPLKAFNATERNLWLLSDKEVAEEGKRLFWSLDPVMQYRLIDYYEGGNDSVNIWRDLAPVNRSPFFQCTFIIWSTLKYSLKLFRWMIARFRDSLFGTR